MKAIISFEFDPDNLGDLARAKKLMEVFNMHNACESEESASDLIQEAWSKCSWEVIAFAIAILQIHDGDSDKGVYAFFESLCNPENQNTCGELTGRIISSRVGRTAIVCKKLGTTSRLMHIAVRRKDGVKRVYISHEAKEALLALLNSSFGDEFKTHLTKNNLEIPDFSQL